MISREFTTRLYDNGRTVYQSSQRSNQEKLYMNIEKMLNGYNQRMDKELYSLIILLRHNQDTINRMLGEGLIEKHTNFGYYRLDLYEVLFNHMLLEQIRPCLYCNAPYSEILIRFLSRELGERLGVLIYQDLLEEGFIDLMDSLLGRINLAVLNGIDPVSREAIDLWDLNNIR